MAHLTQVLRQTRRPLDALARGVPAGAEAVPTIGGGEAAEVSQVPGIGIGNQRGHQGQARLPAQG